MTQRRLENSSILGCHLRTGVDGSRG